MIFRKLICQIIRKIHQNYFTAFSSRIFFVMIFDRNADTRRAQLLPLVAFTAFSGASMFWREIQTSLSEKERNGQSNESADVHE